MPQFSSSKQNHHKEHVIVQNNATQLVLSKNIFRVLLMTDI